VAVAARAERQRVAVGAFDFEVHPVGYEAVFAAEALLDEVAFGPGHGRSGPGFEVAEVEVEQVVVQGRDAVCVYFGVDLGKEVVAEFWRDPYHAVAAVVVFKHQRHALVGEENDVHLVFFGVGGDVFRVDADGVAGDEAFEPVLPSRR